MLSIHNKALEVKNIKQSKTNKKQTKQGGKNLTFDSQFFCELNIDSLKIPENIF